MLSRNNNLSTGQMLARLREGAPPFSHHGLLTRPTIQTCHVPARMHQDFQLEQCLCTTDTCGAGMVDAANSVAAADRARLPRLRCRTSVSPGQNVSLNASGQRRGLRANVSAAMPGPWSSPTINPPAISGREHGHCLGHRPDFGIDHAAVDRHRRPGPSRRRRDPHRAQPRHLRGAGLRRHRRLRDAGDFGAHARVGGPRLPRPPTSSSSFSGGGGGGGGGGSLESRHAHLARRRARSRRARARVAHFFRCICKTSRYICVVRH